MRKAKAERSFDEASSSITMPADFPQEIIEEILSRLPAKSPVTFKYSELVNDSSIDDYKVVRVFTNNDDSSIRLSDVKQTIEVFTLKKSNSWRRIPDIPFASISFDIRLEGTLANACEEFRLVQLPNEPVRSKWDYNLIVVRGCLSMVEVYLESPFVVMWLLKEDGKKNEFWSKFMKIPNQDYFYSEPLCFMRSGEVLLRITYEDRFFELLVLYQGKNLSCRKYSVCGTNLWCEARIFIETGFSQSVLIEWGSPVENWHVGDASQRPNKAGLYNRQNLVERNVLICNTGNWYVEVEETFVETVVLPSSFGAIQMGRPTSDGLAYLPTDDNVDIIRMWNQFVDFEMLPCCVSNGLQVASFLHVDDEGCCQPK
ncbi:hypothetical protein LguiB_025706 [Lonicera macranthoides]